MLIYFLFMLPYMWPVNYSPSAGPIPKVLSVTTPAARSIINTTAASPIGISIINDITVDLLHRTIGARLLLLRGSTSECYNRSVYRAL